MSSPGSPTDVRHFHGGHDGDQPHGRFRHYFGAHLHRRLFMWFGASIFGAGLIAAGVFHAVGGARTGHVRWLPFVVAWVVLWMASGRLARRIARPLYELLRVTQEIGAGRLSARARLPHWRVGEFAVLARAINQMAARIERQIADQRELLAGVSHEIRTPLARIRVLLEIGRQRGGDAHTYDELEREVLEIDALVGQLLASARLDFAALSTRSLDAGDVARRALERAGLEPGGLLQIEAGDDARRFDGDPTLLARALANLLENARRHGGGLTRLGVRARPGFVSFEIDDGGPGFPDAAAPAPHPSAARRPEGSLGLGLVLVRRIADAHHGQLLVATRPEGGARATLELPVTQA
jgi:two-component system, OmpR family, sensor kinase